MNNGPSQHGKSTLFASVLLARAPYLLGFAVATGAAVFGLSFLLPAVFTARTIIIPPQQQQGAAGLALQNLGALAAVAGVPAGLRSSTDQYVALLKSANAGAKLIEQFNLMEVYDVKLRIDAQRELEANSRISAGRKDGLISIEVDDESPERAAALANAYVEQLRRLTSELALTEAQQRRVFFERQMQQAKSNLVVSQIALQDSGFSEGAIRSEPKAFADRYSKLRAEITLVEVRLQATRNALSDATPEVQQARAQLSVLRSELAKAESTNAGISKGDYVNRYRDFKYQEALLELLFRQYELAKVDESRDGPMVQVVDVATTPERKSKPKRGLLAGAAAVLALAAMTLWLALRREAALPRAHSPHIDPASEHATAP